jgi:hypothetical protein
VVASAGNSGAAPDLTGAPATGDRVISVAATDATASIPRSTVLLDSGASVVAQSFGITSPDNGTSLPVFVLRNSAGGISLGCSEAEYVDAQISGKFVVALRGTCPLIDRGHFGQAHGAAGVGIINNAAAGYPPFLGPLPEVPIPFVSFLAADGAALAGSASVTFTASSVIPNPTFRNLASFSSGGPRFGDSFLKPNLTAPGAGIVSTRVGSGNQGQNLGGTSMAAPHVVCWAPDRAPRERASSSRRARPVPRRWCCSTARRRPASPSASRSCRGTSGIARLLPCATTAARPSRSK